MSREITLPILPPLGGVNNDSPRLLQPPNTTIDARNVFPYGGDSRSRISSRPGYASAASTTIIGSGQVNLFQQLSYVSAGAVTQKMYAVAGCIGAGAGKGKLFTIAAGVIRQTTPPSTTIDLASTGGTVPTTYGGVVVHRNRLIAYGPDHQWAASKVDDYGNWDYADRSPSRAFRHTDIINNASGSAADPILTAIPWSNDLLVFAGDHSLWAVRGDLAMGGRVDLLSNGIGILGPSAWTIDPLGNLWIVGAGGIYRGTGGAFTPVNVGHYSDYFQSINRTTNITSCAWDRDRFGLWIFSEGKDSLFFDARNNAFWPLDISSTITAAGIYDGPSSDDRRIFFNSYNGVSNGINQISASSGTDSGGATIASYIYFGPFMPVGADEQAVLRETQITLSNLAVTVTWTLQTGSSPYAAYASPSQTQTGTFSAGSSRQARIRSRLRGTCFYLKLSSSDSRFEFDNGSMSFARAGRYHS